MSATKSTAKFVKTASTDELVKRAAALRGAIDAERNLMIRSSLRQRLVIVLKEMERRSRMGA